MTKPKHSGGPSWKQDHPITLSTNSVQKAERAVKQAMSHPEEIAIEHAFNAIDHAENALNTAEQKQEHLDILHQNKEQLEQIKEQLNEAQDIVEDR